MSYGMLCLMFIISRVCRVQCLSVYGLSYRVCLYRVCRVQCLSCLVFVCLEIVPYSKTCIVFRKANVYFRIPILCPFCFYYDTPPPPPPPPPTPAPPHPTLLSLLFIAQRRDICKRKPCFIFYLYVFQSKSFIESVKHFTFHLEFVLF